jgi:DNA-binding transcriptional MerR regulator
MGTRRTSEPSEEPSEGPSEGPSDEPGVLTIGELATHVGVTVRAIRHYHQRGLLAEPSRDGSGYRRYGARAVADLIRIKTLADAGVPLARVHQLLTSGPEAFARAVGEIDQALQDRIAEFEHRRRQLAGLMAGERLVLAAEVVELLDRMSALGVSDRTITLERDGWTLLMALAPESVAKWAAEKAAALTDPDFQQIYLDWEEAYDWDPNDPRLAALAAHAAAYLEHPAVPLPDPDPGLAAANALLAAQLAAGSPAWRRLEELVRDQAGSPAF